MNTHEKIKDMLAGFALGELSTEQVVLVESHISECQECSKEVKKFAAILECTGQMQKVTVKQAAKETSKESLFAAIGNETINADTETKQVSASIWRIIMKSKITKFTAAAVIMIAVFLGLNIIGGLEMTSITLADVQKSIESKTWILIQFEDGKQEWHNLNEKKSFYAGVDKNGSNFYRMMHDNVNGIKRSYHSNWGYQIHEQPVTPGPFPQTPWEYVTSGWDNEGAGKSISQTIEKSTDTIDARQVIRFDTYNIGPLGIRVLAQQVWADPETRLPIRIRENMGWRRPQEVNTFRTGDFSFPEDGPSNIHDLGAPQDLKVVRNWGVIDPEAKFIIDAAKQAQRQFPSGMRIITKTKYRVSIYYRLNNKFRNETYVRMNNEHNDYLPLDYPESNEQIHQWAKTNLTLSTMSISDGKYEYSYNSGANPQDSPELTLHVEQHGNDDWVNIFLPIRDQWPYTNSVGPMRVLEDDPEMPPGCVLLQHEGLRRKCNWYVDPERDYICVKQIMFRKDKETGKWVKDQDVKERSELTYLTTGQWYARVDNLWGDVRELDVRPLMDSEVELLGGQDDAEGFFDGEKLLKEAMDAGAKITFWAR